MTWLVAKCKKNEIEIFKKNFQNLLKFQPIFYRPKIQIETSKLSKKKKPRFILGNYIFCKLKNFDEKHKKKFNFIKGLDYFLNSYQSRDQQDIENFVKFCKRCEDSNEFLTNTFFNNGKRNKFKFLSGPFKNFFFKIIFEEKNNLLISLDDKKNVLISKNSDYVFI
tara:strand:- start:142 stop:639 length:498 start_codon:yes stop_codon:yes gene_type:complete